MVVVGGLGDASACRDVGTFSFLAQAFDEDLALRLRQVVEMQRQDLMELVDVALVASRRGRGRVVLALVISREDRAEFAVAEFAPRTKSSVLHPQLQLLRSGSCGFPGV